MVTEISTDVATVAQRWPQAFPALASLRLAGSLSSRPKNSLLPDFQAPDDCEASPLRAHDITLNHFLSFPTFSLLLYPVFLRHCAADP